MALQAAHPREIDIDVLQQSIAKASGIVQCVMAAAISLDSPGPMEISNALWAAADILDGAHKETKRAERPSVGSVKARWFNERFLSQGRA